MSSAATAGQRHYITCHESIALGLVKLVTWYASIKVSDFKGLTWTEKEAQPVVYIQGWDTRTPGNQAGAHGDVHRALQPWNILTKTCSFHTPHNNWGNVVPREEALLESTAGEAMLGASRLTSHLPGTFTGRGIRSRKLAPWPAGNFTEELGPISGFGETSGGI